MESAVIPRRTYLRRGRLPLLALLAMAYLIALPPHSARGQEDFSGSIDQVVVAEDGSSATAIVSVADASGQPVAGLTEFDADVDGDGVDVSSVQSVVNEENGVAVLLAIDVSDSMAGEPLTQAKDSAVAFVQGLLPPDQAAVLTFGAGVSEATTFTNERTPIIDTLNSLAVEGRFGTALHDAIIEALEAVTTAPLPRKAILLLTDGQDSGGVSQSTRDEALAAADAGSVPVYAVGLGRTADLALLEELSARAGGAFFRATGPADVPAIFQAIGAALRSQYTIQFDLPPSEDAERELSISFEIDGNRYSASAPFRTEPTVVPGDTGDGGGVSPLIVVLLGAAVLALAGGGAFAVTRRRRQRLEPVRVDLEPGAGEDAPPVPQAELVEITTEGSGRLLVIAGPNAGATIRISAQPVDLGSDPGCALRLDGSNGSVAGTHARVWLQHGRLMLHHLARRQQTLVGQRPVEWATLEPNDTMQIGPHVIAFSLDA